MDSIVHDVMIEEMEKTNNKLKEHHMNAKIARLTGSGVSIAGSLIAILGLGLSPVTFGTSLGFSIGGAVLAVAGGGTIAGAKITDASLQHLNIERVQDQLDRDYQLLDTISQTAKAIKKEIDDARPLIII